MSLLQRQQPLHYRTLENPITRRRIRLPLLTRNSSAAQMDLLAYTNLYLAQPQLSANIATPAGASQQDSSTIPDSGLLPLHSPQPALIEIDHEKQEELNTKLQLSEARNAIVVKSLRKYLPHNSSLTEGYRQNCKLLKLKAKSRIGGTLSNRNSSLLEEAGSILVEPQDQAPSEASRTNIRQTEDFPPRTEPVGRAHLRSLLTERQRIRQIIDSNQANRQLVVQMRNQSQLIERSMNSEFGRVRAACGNILGDGYMLRREIPQEECLQLKRDMHNVSVRCQVLSRSLRKKNL